MSIKLSDSIRVGQQKPLEDKYFNELVPYTSISQVNTLLPETIRHRGLTVNINGEEYWYKDGIKDDDLVFKSSQKTIEVTKPELDVLISENKLEPNRLYKITGVESWCFSQHLIKAIYLKAITNNTLEIEGVGEFYTPKYNTSDSNLGIWKGKLLANGMIDSLSYNIGDKVICGNLFWKNISGNIGTNIKEYYDSENDEYLSPELQNYLSETDWQLITPNDDESLYNINFNIIKYDIENDYINYRADDLGNVYEITYDSLLTKFPNLYLIDIDSQFIYNVNGISLFLWGIDIVKNNNIYESVVLNCNYNHVFQNNIIENSGIYTNTLSNVNFIENTLNFSAISGNILSNVNFIENTLNFSAISGNILSEMSFDRNILNESSVQSNKFLDAGFYRNKLNNSVINSNELKMFGGIIDNTLDDSQISFNKYYFEISNNKLINNSQINNNNDNNIIVNANYSIIKWNSLDNSSTINNNIFVEEGKGISEYRKSIYDNVLTTYCNINNNTIKNGSRIFGHTMNYYSTINGNTLDTDSNIYNNQLIQNGKIDNNILTGHGRIYGNQLDRQSEITLCKLRISPATSYATTMKNNRLFAGKIQNIDFGDIVNPVGSNPNDPAFGGNGLSECIIENNSIIKDLSFPNHDGVGIQFVKMNGASEFKNITINDDIISVEFINTVFDETSDYSKIIQGASAGGLGFTKYYIDNVLLQDRFDEKQDVLTEDNVGEFMDVKLSTKSTPSSGDTVLGRDSLTGKAVEIPTSSLVGGGSGLALGETASTAYRGDRGKIAYDHSQSTGNPHGTTKSDIGLGNVDNTSDLNKPISTATQNALNTKANIVDIPSKTSFTHDILVANWAFVSGKYEAVISNAGILANSFVDVIPSNDNVDIVRSAQIYPSVLISEGSVKVYSKFLPSGTISVTVNII